MEAKVKNKFKSGRPVEWIDEIDKGKVSYMLLSDIFLVEKSLDVSAEEN